MQKDWSEKTQWLVRYRSSAVSLGENQQQGAKKDAAIVHGGYKEKFGESKMVPGWSCGPFLGDLRPGE
eukprot:1145696-Pelagomonas_calceolata.AAC.2